MDTDQQEQAEGINEVDLYFEQQQRDLQIQIQKSQDRERRWKGVEDPGKTTLLEIIMPLLIFAFFLFNILGALFS